MAESLSAPAWTSPVRRLIEVAGQAGLITTAFRVKGLFDRLSNRIPLTAKAIVLDEQDRVLLVRHTHIRGWYLPGGGAKRRETLSEAVTRELREETRIEASIDSLVGVYLRPGREQDRLIAVFLVRSWTGSARAGGIEIADARFFSMTDLPIDVSPATRRRLNDLKAAPAEYLW